VQQTRFASGAERQGTASPVWGNQCSDNARYAAVIEKCASNRGDNTLWGGFGEAMHKLDSPEPGELQSRQFLVGEPTSLVESGDD
jgi:hypothetical protein